MYCKRKGSTGPVFLFTGTKVTSPLFERCEADGSPLAPPAPSATAKARTSKKPAAPAPVVEPVEVTDYVAGDEQDPV